MIDKAILKVNSRSSMNAAVAVPSSTRSTGSKSVRQGSPVCRFQVCGQAQHRGQITHGRFLVNKIQGFRHRKMSRLYRRCPPARRQRFSCQTQASTSPPRRTVDPGFVDRSPHVDTATRQRRRFKRRDVIFSANFTMRSATSPAPLATTFGALILFRHTAKPLSSELGY